MQGRFSVALINALCSISCLWKFEAGFLLSYSLQLQKKYEMMQANVGRRGQNVLSFLTTYASVPVVKCVPCRVGENHGFFK
jgi:hypothetical protein